MQGAASFIHRRAQIYGIPASYSSLRKHEGAFTAAPPAPRKYLMFSKQQFCSNLSGLFVLAFPWRHGQANVSSGSGLVLVTMAWALGLPGRFDWAGAGPRGVYGSGTVD